MDADIWKRHQCDEAAAAQGEASGEVDASTLRFDDTLSRSCFRYPHMIRSMLVHSREARKYLVPTHAQTKRKHLPSNETLWNLAWRGDAAGIRRFASCADVDLLGFVSDTLPAYERGSHRISFGIFLQTSSRVVHKRLQLKRFIRKRCDVVTDVGAAAPLHWACIAGSCKAVGALLDVGASQFVLAGCGATPLHLACGNYHIPLVLVLLSRAAGVGVVVVKKCLDVSRGNPYAMLHGRAWLSDEQSSLELLSADPSGKRGVIALRRFLESESFRMTSQSPVPLPPYTTKR